MIERYWVCDPCGVVRNRRKADTHLWCARCHKPMRKARKFPLAVYERGERKRTREAAARHAAVKRWSVVRGPDGNVIRISPATRAAIMSVLAAKQRRSFQRRAEAFVESLGRDDRTCKHGIVWPKRCEGCSHFIADRGFGGSVGWPAVNIVDHIPGSYGTFANDLAHGYRIEIDWNARGSIAEATGTLIHECVHWLDDYWRGSRTKQGIIVAHGCTFDARLRDLRRRLRIHD